MEDLRGAIAKRCREEFYINPTLLRTATDEMVVRETAISEDHLDELVHSYQRRGAISKHLFAQKIPIACYHKDSKFILIKILNIFLLGYSKEELDTLQFSTVEALSGNWILEILGGNHTVSTYVILSSDEDYELKDVYKSIKITPVLLRRDEKNMALAIARYHNKLIFLGVSFYDNICQLRNLYDNMQMLSSISTKGLSEKEKVEKEKVNMMRFKLTSVTILGENPVQQNVDRLTDEQVVKYYKNLISKKKKQQKESPTKKKKRRSASQKSISTLLNTLNPTIQILTFDTATFEKIKRILKGLGKNRIKPPKSLNLFFGLSSLNDRRKHLFLDQIIENPHNNKSQRFCQ